jgi:general secretion pathway protein D
LLSAADTETDAQRIITNPESGLISVYTTARLHESVASFVNNVQTRALYQVLIEATVVEVNLSDRYQSGVDWATLDRNSGEIDFLQNVLPAANTDFANAPTNILTIDRSGSADAITATISLLSQFGELRVLSSPKLMALNNQAAMLRVVNNEVYFTIDVEPQIINDSGITPAVYTSTATTVQVGFFMTVTPQIGENDQVTLNVRPTISRIVGTVVDPNPAFAQDDITNEVPVIQLSEMESVLKVYSGQVAILGGLMQDSIDSSQDGLPVLSRLPGLRNIFGYRDERASKTELIVFIRPVVVRQPSLAGDLRDYRNYLPANGPEPTGTILPGGAFSLPGGE